MDTRKHNDLYVHSGSCGHFYLSAKETPADKDFIYGHINTNLTIDSNYEAEYKGHDIMPTADFFEFVKTEETPDGFATEYTIPKWDANIRENVTLVPGMNVLVQNTTYTNNSQKDFELSGVASAQVLGIGIGGSQYFESDRFTVHYCRSTWCCEGQWQSKSMADLDIFPGSGRTWEISKFHVGDNGSFSTQEYYPIMIIEDKEEGTAWFFESETPGSWFIELQACSGWLCPFLCVTVGGANEREGFRHNLKPGESYTTQNAFYGMVKGGFTEAVNQLLKYKRATSLKNFDAPAVCYNDFLNANWAAPSTPRILELVDAAAEAGCEYFVIDAGWSEMGSWVPFGKEVFGEMGFEGVIQYIKDKGLIPGVWFEFEHTTFDVANRLGIDDYLLTRHGKVVCDHRPKVNMRSEATRKYLKERVKYVYDLGVRFIKNDHNNSEKMGSTYYGECPSEGTLQNVLAAASFLDEIQAEFPGLVIENCCAGGGRATHGMLKHCYLQSYSDQENYRLAPSIVVGLSACIPPEKMGIWSSPYPLLCHLLPDVPETEKVLPQEIIDRAKDGEETAYNMVTSMMGLMYLAGKICHADDLNKSLIRDAIAVYKSYRHIMNTAEPVFLLPMRHITDKTYNAYGLKDPATGDLLLAVWNLETGKFTLDLEKYGYKTAELLYPSALGGVKWKFNGKQMQFTFAKDYSARLFRLKK
ncbi:MAG: alpha-galactosidase [Oscillospiraceae bacterium]|nr:alpha-galactosidase [Oscillospiraceae bacterium]